jgi:hypothetical protein
MTERPRQVSNAITLLWFSLALSLPSWVLSSERAPEAFSPVAVLLNLALLALFAWLIVRIGQGRNWARVACLGLTLFGVALGALPEEGPDQSALEMTIYLSDLVISLLAMYWLFTPPGAGWFARPAPPAPPGTP